MSSLQIAFPAVGDTTLVAPPAPQSAGAGYLESIADTAEKRETFSGKALLQGETLEKAKRDGKALANALVGPGVDPSQGNTLALLNYGNGAVEKVNNLVDQLLRDMKPEDIPELDKIVENLMREARGLRRKYDPSDDKVREKYKNYKGKAFGLFGNARTLIELLLDDTRSLEQKMDKVEKLVDNRQAILIRNVTSYDILYRATGSAVDNLIYVVGAMELARDDIAARIDSVPVGNASLGDRGADTRAALAETANNLDMRIGGFKKRIFTASSTGPRIRMARSAAVTMALKLDELVALVIPTLKETAFEWGTMINTYKSAQLAESVDRAAEEALEGLSTAHAVIMPLIARSASRPGLSPEAVYAMGAKLDEAATGVLEAFRASREERAALETAMVETGRAMNASMDKLSDGLVDQIVASNKAPLQIAKSIGVES